MQYGCLPAKKDYRDYTICSSAVLNVEYPKEFILENLPAVKQQDNINSCCAHALSSILEYFNNNKHTLSTNFIYGIQHKEFNQNLPGMYLAQACQIVQKYGDVLEQDCPGNIEVPNSWTAAEAVINNQQAMEEGYKYRTTSYYTCNTDNDIKYALMNYGPVLAAIDWKEKYSISKTGKIRFSKTSSGGGHAVMVCGWNKSGWVIQNSWGSDWGKEGRFILPFEYGFLEARAIIDYEDDQDIALKKPVNNRVFNIFYKAANYLANFSKH